MVVLTVSLRFLVGVGLFAMFGLMVVLHWIIARLAARRRRRRKMRLENIRYAVDGLIKRDVQ